MRLTRQTDYAVRILMFCATNGELSRVSQIAEFYAISELFLFKILQVLSREGFIETVRGRNGGIRLPRPPEQINLGAVVRAVEDNFDLVECHQDSEAGCPLVTSCGMSEALREALEAFFVVLDGFTLQDCVNKERNIGVLARLEAMKTRPLAER